VFAAVRGSGDRKRTAGRAKRDRKRTAAVRVAFAGGAQTFAEETVRPTSDPATQWLDLLERVGRSRLAHEDARGALQMADQAIALDGLHESSWRLALQAEQALGLRESITRGYDELTRSLDE